MFFFFVFHSFPIAISVFFFLILSLCFGYSFFERTNLKIRTEPVSFEVCFIIIITTTFSFLRRKKFKADNFSFDTIISPILILYSIFLLFAIKLLTKAMMMMIIIRRSCWKWYCVRHQKWMYIYIYIWHRIRRMLIIRNYDVARAFDRCWLL